ncbi:hypothetical protein HanLR1_Chr01g0021591 [Helianthus annuus]|nr:hypothetical protein HanLR1_Chr01g0021591 [Helianthus annuus]
MEFMVLDYRTDWDLEVNEPVAGKLLPSGGGERLFWNGKCGAEEVIPKQKGI